jgi:hypothetical protein
LTEGTSNYHPDPIHIVIPDDYPPTYASPEQEDLERLAQHGRVTLHSTRAADRAELFDRLASAEVGPELTHQRLLADSRGCDRCYRPYPR